MSSPRDKRLSLSEKSEIERIVSQNVDEEPNAERMQRLQELIRSRVDGRQYYAAVMQFHVLLDHELEVSLTSTRPLLSPSIIDTHLRGPLGEGESGDRRRSSGDCPGGTPWWLSAKVGALSGVAALLAVACSAFLFSSRPIATLQADGDPQRRHSNAPVVASRSAFLVKHSETLQLVSQLTRTASLSRLELPTEGHGPGVLGRGVAWMERGDGRRERSYLLKAPPRSRIEVHVDANASGRNLLSVIQMDDSISSAEAQRSRTGALTFDNLLGETVRSTTRGNGSLGNYTDYNDSARTHYYLLTGSHVNPEKPGSSEWSQSDYEVVFESSDVIVLGWDDSRYVAAKSRTKDHFRDGDYNDLRAIVHLSNSDIPTESAVVYSPPPAVEGAARSEHSGGRNLDVLPGQVLVIVVTRATLRESEMLIRDIELDEVVWREAEGPCRQLANSIETVHRVYVIRNHTSVAKRYALSCCYRSAGSECDGGADRARWSAWPIDFLFEGVKTVTFGFSDPPDAPVGPDYSGVSVHARWFSG